MGRGRLGQVLHRDGRGVALLQQRRVIVGMSLPVVGPRRRPLDTAELSSKPNRLVGRRAGPGRQSVQELGVRGVGRGRLGQVVLRSGRGVALLQLRRVVVGMLVHLVRARWLPLGGDLAPPTSQGRSMSRE
ncbi:MAG: hypothetical protein BGP03_05790 [Pseudonocardia sp. 73-21]|nr:MAG: hypothetical protein BGP03_05790 [Pseudonocardia sp. 73-21]